MKTCLLVKLCSILMLLVLLCRQSYAQERDPIPRNWLNAGIWYPAVEPFFSSYSTSVNISYHYQVNANLFSLRGLWTGDFCLDCDDPNEFWDMSLLYGRSTASEYFHASVSAGLGIIGGDRADTFDEQRKVATTIGAAFQAQFFLYLSSSYGIGIYSFANINSQTQFYGVTLNLQIGKLR